MSKYENYTKEQLIAKIATHESKKNYGLVWDDEKEPENVVLECQNNIPILKKIDGKTIQTDKNKPNNILIEGDNYHALQVLNYTHKGQIDVIYIDPPYNTGNKDFKYNDSFVDKEDGYRHSKWLNFMSKRLKLAHNLLKDSGVIFISIDDNEMAQLKILCDETFGEKCCIGIFTKKIAGGKNDSKTIKLNHEYLLCYCRKETTKLKLNRQISLKETTVTLQKWGDEELREDRPDMWYPIYANLDSGQISLERITGMIEILPIKNDGTERRWRWGRKTAIKDLKKLTLVETEDDFGDVKYDIHVIMPKGTISELPWSSFIPEHSAGGGTVLNAIMGKKIVGMYPKNIEYIKWIANLALSPKPIILDFFAGSGTTGHAILDLNKDGGNRQFILCTNNENDICTDVTYPRLSKVINGYSTPKGVYIDGLGGNLDYYKTDLVPTDGIANISDTTREELTKKAGNMIAIKENTHALIELNDHYQIFQNKTTAKQTAIYFTEDLSHFDELIEKIKKHKTKLYIFSFGKIDKSSYKYLGKNFEIEDIPEPIIEIYKEINKEGIL